MNWRKPKVKVFGTEYSTKASGNPKIGGEILKIV